MAEEQKVYPKFSVEPNKSPNRWLAFPIIGIMVKIILLIPVFIESFFLGVAALFVLFINWFVVLFTGKYWETAHTYFVALMRFWGKIELYIYGITDKYPGFALNTNGLFELEIAKPEKPNRWLAVPFLGIFVRFILLIPYLIFADVLQRGSSVAMVLSWFVVLFKGRFPESLYEFERDTLRVSFASSAYIVGLSDKYPSFAISMNHQTAKILLIIVGALLTAGRMEQGWDQPDKHQSPKYKYESQQDYSTRSQAPMDYKTY